MPNWNRVTDRCIRTLATSEDDTIAIGRQIADRLSEGDFIALIGNLGAGKTRLVKAIAEALGVASDEVNSPTFTLIQEYAGRIFLRHCDTYRLRNAEEFADLGLDELFADDGIALVEWADRVVEYLPRDRLEIRITIDTPTTRFIEVTATGKRSQKILERLFEPN